MLNLSIPGVSAEGHCPNDPGLSQVLGGARHRNWSRKLPRGAKPLMDIRLVWGRVVLGLLRPRADAAR